MTPETLDRFRKTFHQMHLDNPEAEALAQAGCTLVGEVERLTKERDLARSMAMQLANQHPPRCVCWVCEASRKWNRGVAQP